MKASKLLGQGCVGYWCYAIEAQEKEEKEEDIHVVCEFKDVFPEELLGSPPQWEIDFKIELVLGAQPISRGTYRMVLTELTELKIQLGSYCRRDLLGQVYHYGAPQSYS